MRHFCGAKKLGPDNTFIHCLRVYLLLVSPVGYSHSKGRTEENVFSGYQCRDFNVGNVSYAGNLFIVYTAHAHVEAKIFN